MPNKYTFSYIVTYIYVAVNENKKVAVYTNLFLFDPYKSVVKLFWTFVLLRIRNYGIKQHGGSDGVCCIISLFWIVTI